MEVKIEPKAENARILEVFLQGESQKLINKVLYKRHLSKIRSFKNFIEEFTALEKKVALGFCLTILAKRAYTKFELTKEMEKRLISEDAISSALGKVAPYLDDEAILKRLVEVHAQRGKGARAILVYLRKKTDLNYAKLMQMIEENLPFEVQLEKAKALIEKKGRPQDRKEMARIYRFLLSRGYSHDIAQRALQG